MNGSLIVGRWRAVALLALLSITGACRSSGPPVANTEVHAVDEDRRAIAGRLPRYPADFARIRPLTRAERSRFTETSRHADVVQFIDSLRSMGARIHVGSLGRSGGGLEIPYIVASRPVVTTPQEAKRLNRPIVFVQGNIHGGEVEGKEALLAFVRDLVSNRFPNMLDSIVLIAVPIYNADGNERVGPQERNRASQQGPATVGERANGDSLDLNRDYVKAEAPETRAALAFFAAWEPDVFVDLHTTNGSYHGFALTYAPPLNPASLVAAPFTRDTLLVSVRRRMRLDFRLETFDYGNFVHQDSVERGWFTYDHRPRFGTNYFGLRGRPAVLVEAYSHDPFEKRVATTYAFLFELLGLIAENAADVLEVVAESDRRATGWGTLPASSPRIPVRATPVTIRRDHVRAEILERTGDSTRTEAGVPRGVRRTGRYRTVTIPIYDRFGGTLHRTLPHAYAFPAAYVGAAELLRRHGVFVERVDAPLHLQVERFVVDSLHRAPAPFQRHREVRLTGRWWRDASTLPPGSFVVRSGQPLALLALYLLEPESDDGLVTWNLFDAGLRVGENAPVVRVVQPIVAGVSEFGR